MLPFLCSAVFKPNEKWIAVLPPTTTATTFKGNEGENGITIDFDGNNVTYIPVNVPAELSTLRRTFSKEDWVLLDAMGSFPTPQCSGRFLTMHKRRRKKLTTRALAWQDHGAILDDIHHGLVKRILDHCGAWAFNAFTLETVAGGRSLPVLCVHLFHWYGLLDHFQLDVVRVWKLFTLIEEGYHSTNPYHNSIHATDVTQAMHCFLQEEQIKRNVTPLEIMAALIGAVAHDLDHPGVNQHFLITTSNHLAVLYENKSVLENHHWRSAIGCLLESGVAQQLHPYRDDLERQIRDLILATDINRQREFLDGFKSHIDRDTLDLRMAENRQFLLQIALKCADISNPTRPWDISHKWSMKVCDEFFRQGEFERELGLPVTSICDQQSISVAKIQVGFFRAVVTPLFYEWHRFMRSPLSTHMMQMLDTNRRRWEEQERAEQAEETQTELSDAEEPIQAISDDEEEELTRQSLDISIHDFMPPPQHEVEVRRQSLAVPPRDSYLDSRRHSVPVHMVLQAGSPQKHLPRTIHRRESLPVTATLKGRSPISPQPDSRASSGPKEEDELLQYGSQSSVVSSSGSPYHSSEENPERPLSAENLLPEPSIASMSSSSAIRHLTSVLQNAADRAAQGGSTSSTGSSATKCLTRQQTFPPPAPYMRKRYMSATMEMSTCPEIPHEGDSRTSSSRSSHENISKNTQQTYTIPAIAVLSPNNSKTPDLLLMSQPCNNNKREPEEKRVRLSDSSSVTFCEKENLDPRETPRRRGSAPVFLPISSQSKPDDLLSSAGGGLNLVDIRRGSAPIEITRHFRSFDEDNNEHIINITPVETNRTFWLQQRRGSAPVDLPPSGMVRHEFTRHTSLNGKARGGGGRGKKQQLRRRSSGGPEIVGGGGGGETSGGGGGGGDLLTRFGAPLQCRITPSQSPEALLARRRGSLPLEVLTVGHSVF